MAADPELIEVEIVLTEHSQELLDQIEELADLVPESCHYEASIIFDKIADLIGDSIRCVDDFDGGGNGKE